MPFNDVEQALRKSYKKGLLIKEKVDDQSRYYLTREYMEGLIGKPETFFINEEYVELWKQLQEEHIERLISLYEGPMGRVLPIERSVADPSSMRSFESTSRIVEGAQTCIINLCTCRAIFNNCGNSCSTCMMFDEAAEFFIERGMAEEAPKNRVMAVIKASEDAGLINTTSVHLFKGGKAQVLCHCCTCCCIVSKLCRLSGGSLTLMKSNYYPKAESKECILCSRCAKACPFNAIRVGNKGIEINMSSCVGCGLCTLKCPSEALKLHRSCTTQPVAVIEKNFINKVPN